MLIGLGQGRLGGVPAAEGRVAGSGCLRAWTQRPRAAAHGPKHTQECRISVKCMVRWTCGWRRPVRHCERGEPRGQMGSDLRVGEARAAARQKTQEGSGTARGRSDGGQSAGRPWWARFDRPPRGRCRTARAGALACARQASRCCARCLRRRRRRGSSLLASTSRSADAQHRRRRRHRRAAGRGGRRWRDGRRHAGTGRSQAGPGAEFQSDATGAGQIPRGCAPHAPSLS